MAGVCTPWVTGEDLTWPEGVDAPTDADLIAQWCDYASDVLYNMSGQQWPGVCTDTVRPCAKPRVGDVGVSRVARTFLSQQGSAGWWPGPGRGDVGFCTCNRSVRTGDYGLPELRLAGPVVSITSVKIDGITVPSNEYRVDDGRYLVGLLKPDGSQREWPCCQDMSKPPTARGTFQVVYTFGAAPPSAGATSAGVFAVQLILAAVGNPKCKLPDLVKTVARQGVTISMYDPTMFATGQVGLQVVDRWLSSLRVAEQRRGGSVLVPGRGRRHRRTG